METKKPPFWSSLWFLWLVLTALYLIGFFTFGISEGIYSLVAQSNLADLGDVVTLVVGIFVPYGPFNIFSTVGQMISPFLILLMINNNKMLSSLSQKPWSKLFVNLLILAIFTAVVDLLVWGEWRSVVILLGGLH